MKPTVPALLALADGSIFEGISIGAEGVTVGEVVFNTAMTGYQEILTDPSYREQIVTLTYPHIGNVGTNAEDAESEKVQLAGLVLREAPRPHANFRSTQDFREYLRTNRVVAIAGIGGYGRVLLTGLSSRQSYERQGPRNRVTVGVLKNRPA